MHFNFNDFSFTLLVCGLAALIMSIIIFRRSGSAVKQFSYITFVIAIWSIAYSFELSCNTYEEMIFWVKVEYIGIAFLPAMWFQFIAKFIGKSHWLSTPRLILLYIVPTLTYIAVLTNDYHHLHYLNTQVDNLGPFPLLDITVGPWYIVHTIFFYLVLFAGLYLLITKFINADKVYRQQNYVIVIGTFIPWVINIFYLFDFRPYGHVDLTPFAFLTTCLVIGFGLLQFKLFDIIPVARDKIIEDLSDGVLVLDSLNRIIDLNTQFKKFISTEFNKQVKVGELYSSYFGNYAELIDAVSNRVPSVFELNLNNHCYEITINPLFEKTTIYSGVILIHRNITERKKSEKLLQKQSDELSSLNQLKDKMFSIIAHDLRAPIINLKEIMSLFDQELISDEELKSHLPLINSEIKTTSSLLENLLYWSRTQLKGERINPDYLNLRLISIVQLNLIDPQVKDKKLQIHNTIPENAIVYADKNMIELVLRNLISNAVKYCHVGNKIMLSAKTADGFCTIEIKDNGIGIEEKNISKLFGMNNYSTAGTHAERGTGIGLLLCKEFVEKNGGKIWVESVFGEGSTFRFSLPTSSSH